MSTKLAAPVAVPVKAAPERRPSMTGLPFADGRLNAGCINGFDRIPGREAERRGELEAMALVQEEIKRIVAVTEAVSLAATNALLVARRAGTLSVGFGVVAGELRCFAGSLGQAMEELTLRVFGLVGAVASKMQRSCKMDKLCATCRSGAEAQRHIAVACRRSLEDFQAQVDLVRKLTDSLETALARAEKQCVMGLAVGRAARIEAAYGGAYQSVLHQIAVDVEGTVDDLLRRVRALSGAVAERSA